MTDRPVKLARHVDHDPALICRPAGYGLCEVLEADEDAADADAAREARASIDAGEPVIPWEQIKAEAVPIAKGAMPDDGDGEADYDDSAEEFISIARVDWLVSKSWRKLHAVRDEDWSDEHRADMEEHWGVSRPVRLACGRVAASAWIPGVFTRMGAQRCAGCCRALGYPEGKGSPKNDDACRVLLGLPADGGPARPGSETAATG